MSEFFDEINAVLPEMEAEFGEKWTFGSSTFNAIAIEDLKFSKIISSGGTLSQATVSLFVRAKIWVGSGAERGSILTVRGQKVRIMDVINEGDASVNLVCGPVTMAMPRT